MPKILYDISSITEINLFKNLFDKMATHTELTNYIKEKDHKDILRHFLEAVQDIKLRVIDMENLFRKLIKEMEAYFLEEINKIKVLKTEVIIK